ncbi:histidine kinase, partial [Xanthomonas sp. Kuri4-1]
MNIKLLCLLAGLLTLPGPALDAAPWVETPRMRRLGIADGLPSRMVLALAQDRQGHVWAATDDGLARYDGVGLRVWRHDPADPASLPANSVETLLVDPLDRVWVGTHGGGLGMLDRRRSGFARFDTVDRSCDSPLWSLAYAQHALWIGSSESGLCRRGEDGRVTRFRARPGDPAALPSDTIYSMLTDVRGRLWIGTGAGLVRRDGERFTRVFPERLDSEVLKLSQAADGTLWIGSGAGLWRLSPNGELSPAPWATGADLRG